MPVKWQPPDEPWLKLNIAGSFLPSNNKASGGGIIRDQTGKFVSGFFTTLCAYSALESELMAMVHGLDLAKDMGRSIWVESSSLQAVDLINADKLGPAQV